MKRTIIDSLRWINPFSGGKRDPNAVGPLPYNDGKQAVRVFVEGYEDVAFWRGIFDHFANPKLRFEISVPLLETLPKGKKVLLHMLPESNERLLLCVDSDFDYLFGRSTEQSRQVCDSPFMFHTYTYATENYLCYAPPLNNVCVKATKNDTRIFDFERFMAEYSRRIYRVLLWYVMSAHEDTPNIFTLGSFKAAVRIGYLELADGGRSTLDWVGRNAEVCCRRLAERNRRMAAEIDHFGKRLRERGLEPDNAYLFMHGHTLMDNVVMVVLQTVCQRLRQLSIQTIHASKMRGVAFNNEMSNLKNTQRSIRDVLLDNENYTACPLYRKLQSDIEAYLKRTLGA